MPAMDAFAIVKSPRATMPCRRCASGRSDASVSVAAESSKSFAQAYWWARQGARAVCRLWDSRVRRFRVQ